MKKIKISLIFTALVSICIIISCKIFNDSQSAEYRNFYGIAWNGTAHDNLAYSRQMGYDYVFYQKGMELDSLSDGLYFYVETPEYSVYPRWIQSTKTYSPEEINFYEKNFALMNNKRFPNNLARGWFREPDVFTVQPDLQQQRVVTWVIDSILRNVQSIESRNPNFNFGGFAWDVPQPAGDFWDTIQRPGKQITLAFWTGGDYGIKHPEAIHDYPTYSDGRLEFYKQLYKETRKVFTHARFIMEPYRIYDDWIKVVKDRTDAREVTPDILAQERFGTEFADDSRIYESGLITRENVASTTPDRFSDADNRLYAAKAAINGSWFSWYGRFGGTGDMPSFKNVYEIPARLKLIRTLANWENLNKIPLDQRSWDGFTYKSPGAYADSNIIFLKQPREDKIFVVFMKENGSLDLDKDIRLKGIYSTDSLFRETVPAAHKFNIQDKKITPGDSSCLNRGYIIHFR